MAIVPVPKLNIPGSAGASAAWAMEASSAAAGTLRETGSQASAAPDPTFQNVQGIYTTEELVAEKRGSMIILLEKLLSMSQMTAKHSLRQQ